jgi:fructose-bisphosphate aldolase, class II
MGLTCEGVTLIHNTTAQAVRNAYQSGLAVLAFNVPYLPMVEPIVRAVVDQDYFALIETARLEWLRFDARSSAAVMEEFKKFYRPAYVALHLDHVPVIDEQNCKVDYLSIIREAIAQGYHSVMVDASRLDLEGNIRATRQAVKLAHQAGIPCEAELGSVLGHESGPLPPYEELFLSRRGFTRVAEAVRFVRETGCDWLSVAIGTIHGPTSGALMHEKKLEARLDLELLEQLHGETGIPLVLHGGSGCCQESVRAAVQMGIAKINVGTELRQAYENGLKSSGAVTAAQQEVYERACWLIRDVYGFSGTRQTLLDRGVR